MFMARRAVGDRGFIRWQQSVKTKMSLSQAVLLFLASCSEAAVAALSFQLPANTNTHLSQAYFKSYNG